MRTEEYRTLVRLIRELASEVRNVKTGLDSKIDHVAKKVTEAFQGFGILDPEEYGAAQADADARKYGVDKGSQIFFHNEPSFFLDVGNTAQQKNAVMRYCLKN